MASVLQKVLNPRSAPSLRLWGVEVLGSPNDHLHLHPRGWDCSAQSREGQEEQSSWRAVKKDSILSLPNHFYAIGAVLVYQAAIWLSIFLIF